MRGDLRVVLAFFLVALLLKSSSQYYFVTKVHIACQNNNFFKAIWGVTITEGHIDLKWKSLRGKF
jgi:hypothetical protein